MQSDLDVLDFGDLKEILAGGVPNTCGDDDPTDVGRDLSSGRLAILSRVRTKPGPLKRRWHWDLLNRVDLGKEVTNSDVMEWLRGEEHTGEDIVRMTMTFAMLIYAKENRDDAATVTACIPEEPSRKENRFFKVTCVIVSASDSEVHFGKPIMILEARHPEQAWDRARAAFGELKLPDSLSEEDVRLSLVSVERIENAREECSDLLSGFPTDFS